jgi:uncharacterized membrane protein
MGLSANTPKYFFRLVNVLLGVAFFFELLRPEPSPALDATLIVLAAFASILALNSQLPLQNVLPAALIAAVFGGVAHALSGQPHLSMPFGPVVFSPNVGDKIFGTVPWTIPLLWVVAIFTARGVARLILRPWRKVKNYGYWLIGLTSALAVAYDFALEPFAWHVKQWWLWQHTKIPVTWQGAALMNFLGWAFVSLLIMMFATPSLIRKQPGNQPGPDFHPLILWLGALLLFAVGLGEVHRWGPVAVDVAIAGVTAVFAFRGAKW